MARFYVLCDDDCRYEGMTKAEILEAIEQALEQGYVSDPDGAVFSRIKEINTNGTVQIWSGTEAEFNALSPTPTVGLSVVRVGADGVLYLCANDSLIQALSKLQVDNTVTKEGENAVSGAAVAAYVTQELGKIADYDGEGF